MVIVLTSGGHLELLCMCKNISYDKNMQTCFFGMQTIYLIANLNIYLVFTAHYNWLAGILVAILNFLNSSRVSSWHPVDCQSGPLKDSNSAKNNYASTNSGFTPPATRLSLSKINEHQCTHLCIYHSPNPKPPDSYTVSWATALVWRCDSQDAWERI